MIDVRVNAPDARTEYLDGASECFPDWGGNAMYDWAFGRRVDGTTADVMILHGPDGPLAGSGVSYRSVHARGGPPLPVAVMTGSWTRPAARGQGCFTRVIEESRRLAIERQAGLLLAFVTADNASARRLIDAGAATFRTWYCFSGRSTPRPCEVRSRLRPQSDRATLARVGDLATRRVAGTTSFTYPSARAWAGQFIDRPAPVDILAFDEGWVVRERAAASDRINLLIGDAGWSGGKQVLAALLADALDHARQLFLFTTDESVAELCRGLAMEIKSGYVTALVADQDQLAHSLDTHSAIEINSRLLEAPSGPWSLGAWRVHGGDRV